MRPAEVIDVDQPHRTRRDLLLQVHHATDVVEHLREDVRRSKAAQLARESEGQWEYPGNGTEFVDYWEMFWADN
jgi:hypothetical protein